MFLRIVVRMSLLSIQFFKVIVHVRDYGEKQGQKFQVILIQTLCTGGHRICESIKTPVPGELTTCTHRVCYMTKNMPNNDVEPNLECIAQLKSSQVIHSKNFEGGFYIIVWHILVI